MNLNLIHRSLKGTSLQKGLFTPATVHDKAGLQIRTLFSGRSKPLGLAITPHGVGLTKTSFTTRSPTCIHVPAALCNTVGIQTRTVFAQRFTKNEKRQRLAMRRKAAAKTKRNDRVWRIRTGDEVFVEGKMFADPDDKFSRGAKGVVQLVDRIKATAFVTGVGVKEVEKRSSQTGQNFVKHVNTPVPYDSLYLLDPVDGQPCGSKFVRNEDGRIVRISTRSGEEIPFFEREPTPHSTFECDTLPESVLEVTLSEREIAVVGEYDENRQNLFPEREKQRRLIKKLKRVQRIARKKAQKVENLKLHKIHSNNKKKTAKKPPKKKFYHIR
uniref:Large ribosomal subunit protein uL24 C-terminal domain-containing protein n=2 Tax=Aplanochytrium stocchinoi TaxID=215587 RepID=A0A7S3PGX7_9STRA|mmetsp:Transcript_5708/g.6761  ORF Transcript_5708/g.6761 Transcript_5708/m.6761 type:complete len:327 (+) Transcript_5708:218-1198(+)